MPGQVGSASGEGAAPAAEKRATRFSALASKRRQLVLLKSLNLVPKSARPNGARRSHARSNGKAAGGGALTHAQLEAAEAGPGRQAQPPSSPAAPRVRKDAEAGGGTSERRETTAGPHVEGAYHACALPPRFPSPSGERASCGS